MSQQNTPDLSQVIAEEFGANATYVETLLERFRSNPDLVDDSWRAYFSELTSNGATAVVTTTEETARRQPQKRAQPRPLRPHQHQLPKPSRSLKAKCSPSAARR